MYKIEFSKTVIGASFYAKVVSIDLDAPNGTFITTYEF